MSTETNQPKLASSREFGAARLPRENELQGNARAKQIARLAKGPAMTEDKTFLEGNFSLNRK